MPPPLQSEQEQCAASQQATQHMWKLLAQYIIIIATLCTMILTPTEPKPYHMYINLFRADVGGWTPQWTSRLYLLWAGTLKGGISWASSCSMLLWCSRFEVCKPRGTVSNIFVYVSHWTYHPTHWRMLPTFEQHYFKVFPENPGDIFISTILYDIRYPSQCQYPPFTDNTLQPKTMALLPARSRGHRWDPYSMYTSCKGTWHVSEPKRVFVPELPVCVFIWPNIHLWVHWVGGISNGQPGVGGCTGLWIRHTRWALLSSRCRVSRRPPAAASLSWC